MKQIRVYEIAKREDFAEETTMKIEREVGFLKYSPHFLVINNRRLKRVWYLVIYSLDLLWAGILSLVY